MTEVQFQMGKPTIAAVGGTARGGGMTIAISCDMIVASSDATFGYPEIDAGVLPSIHFTHLPRIVGKHRAFELLFTGRAFNAQEAQSLGLVSRLTEPGQALGALAPRPVGQGAALQPHGAGTVGEHPAQKVGVEIGVIALGRKARALEQARGHFAGHGQGQIMCAAFHRHGSENPSDLFNHIGGQILTCHSANVIRLKNRTGNRFSHRFHPKKE